MVHTITLHNAESILRLLCTSLDVLEKQSEDSGGNQIPQTLEHRLFDSVHRRLLAPDGHNLHPRFSHHHSNSHAYQSAYLRTD